MANRSVLTVAVVCTALCCAAGSVAAQDGESAPLSLNQCLELALANNLDLVSAKKDPEIAEKQIEVNRAPFDGVIGAGATYNQAEGDEVITNNATGVTTPPVTSESDVPAADVSFSHLLHYGGSYALTANWQDVDFSTTAIEAATGFLTGSTLTQSTQRVTLSYEMPLLAGFGKESTTINLMLARSGLDISREELRGQAMLILNRVEDAYWNVLAAREALRIERLALGRAQDLLELNRKKVEVGTLAPIEITQAEAGVASQQEGVIVAQVVLENAEDALLQLLAVPEDSALWDQSLELTDRPSFAAAPMDLDDAIATALESRPDLVSARQRLRTSELSERVARKNTRHDLDLTARITPNEQQDSDRLVEILAPPGLPTSNTTTAGDETNWQIGLRYTYPLRNRAAKANYAIAQLTTNKSELSVRAVEQQVRVDVRVALRAVDSGIERVEAARKNVELQQKKLEAEQKKFENGMSTSFEVLTFQNDLASAELSEIRARLDYLKALAALERAKGTLLEARGMQLGS